MIWIRRAVVSAPLIAVALGCGNESSPHSLPNAANMQSSSSREIKTDRPNKFGFAKISIRDGDDYLEGIVDDHGTEIVQPRASLLVNDIDGKMALLQVERKFLFAPLDQGPISPEDISNVAGFQYAEPYRCGLAMVMINDIWFYIDSEGSRAFESDFEFAESFHHDRALVKANDRYRIIDTHGKTIANLDYDQVNLQSPWCWQVTNVDRDKYMSGFVDLSGKPITELEYDDVGYYDPEVMRIRVRKNNRLGFLDEFAKVAIEIQYEYAEVFDRGKARVALNGRIFYIDPNGKEVID